GKPVQDAFRRGLGYAAQWYEVLQIRLEQQVDAAVLDADICIQSSKIVTLTPSTPSLSALFPLDSNCSLTSPSSPTLPQRPPTSLETTLVPGECNLFGRSLERDGGDIQVCVDGNFNHRHLRSAGDSPHFYEPTYILSKEFVDNVGARMDKLRTTRKPRPPRKPLVPDEAINECESSHTAGKGSNIKTNMEKFDDGGLMALVCRHNIPIFLANIDTPGEQQKYSVAMIEYLFSFIPPSATLAVLYDVGCVLDRSLCAYNFLSPDITERVLLATSVMHAFVHQWACQIVNNPRIRTGLGLTDGEGVERLWSRMRKLIAVTRGCGRSRRLYIVDRQVASIGVELRNDLGAWIRRRLNKVDIPILRSEWELQRASELSIRAQAPARLKKELDTVLALQGDLETCEKTLQATRSTLAKALPSPESLRILTSLQDHHERLKDDIEDLYTSLSLQDSYPELQGVDLEFVKLLLIARDLKINVRKRAVGSFFEWERLDQASGGRNHAIGTKLHQATRAAIKKRAPALMAGLRKYNDICAMLAAIYKPEWKIPLPEPLPTELKPLRDATSLMEDVWISHPAEEVPRWLSDGTVREGIRALLKVERCTEKWQRLQTEAFNLSRWFGRELAAIELALIKPSNSSLRVPLEQRRSRLLDLCSLWTSPLVPQHTFDFLASQAMDVAQSLSECRRDGAGDASSNRTCPAPTFESIDNEDVPEEGGLDLTTSTDEVLFDDYLLQTVDNEMHEVEVLGPDVDIVLILHPPQRMLLHRDLLTQLSFHTLSNVEPLTKPRYFPHLRGRFVFGTKELSMMRSPTSRLNDVCINGISALLKYQFSRTTSSASRSSQQCALLSTYDLPMLRYNASDAKIWRQTRHTEYWKCQVWILPIHRSTTEHWVMCTIIPSAGEIHLFDSLAQEEPWKAEIQ
ncbi:hypothetical protein C0992_006324, partial [Termitomyces sp. T32_za158]